MVGDGPFGALLRKAQESDGADVMAVVASVAAGIGFSDVVGYLADFEQEVLEPLGDLGTHAHVSSSEKISASVAGRAFLRGEVVVVERPDGARLWAPILEGTDVTGIVAVTVFQLDDGALEMAEMLGRLAGYLLATWSNVTDRYNVHRRRKPMSLPASLQWDLLPPLTLSSRSAVAAGMLEPAYDVGGDAFDYALNGSILDVAIMDAMGHGLRSAMNAALAVGTFRHARREGRTLPAIHEHLNATVRQENEEGFVTGHVGQLNLGMGTYTCINAGHPSPLLVRNGRVVGPLEGPRTLPWGLGDGKAQPFTTSLEPGDCLLLYTDGITDVRGRVAEPFGFDRLIDIVEQHASEQVPLRMVVRTIVRSVVEHHNHDLRDDATVLMVQWLGPIASLP